MSLEEGLEQAAPVPFSRKLIGLKDLATKTDMPASWLKEQADEGLIPCLRVGMKTFFNESAVVDALFNMSTTAAPRDTAKRTRAAAAADKGAPGRRSNGSVESLSA